MSITIVQKAPPCERCGGAMGIGRDRRERPVALCTACGFRVVLRDLTVRERELAAPAPWAR